MNLDEILLKPDINYEKIDEFLEVYNEDNYYKILSRIGQFTENDAKRVCKKIIDKSNNQSLIDRTCMEIITFIQYDYNYYKDIINIISLKDIDGTWIDEIINKLLENSNKTVKDVFEDFSSEIPQNINYDISIIKAVLDKYDEKYIINLELEKNKIIEICKRMNYLMTINIRNIIRLFYDISSELKLNLEEINVFLNEFFENYPSICKEFIEKESNYNSKGVFIKELKRRVEQYDKEEKIKYNMEIFKPDIKRTTEYMKYQLKQNKEINKMARQKSILWNLAKQNTILYGKKYGIVVVTEHGKKISVGSLQEYKYECPYATECLIDPVEYIEKIYLLKNLGRGNKNETNTEGLH